MTPQKQQQHQLTDYLAIKFASIIPNFEDNFSFMCWIDNYSYEDKGRHEFLIYIKTLETGDYTKKSLDIFNVEEGDEVKAFLHKLYDIFSNETLTNDLIHSLLPKEHNSFKIWKRSLILKNITYN